jgi:hypothetical protein
VVQFRLGRYTFREVVSSAGGCLFNTKSEERGQKMRDKEKN